MSDMRNYCAVRFKFKDEYNDIAKLLDVLHSRGFFLEAKDRDGLYDRDKNYAIVWDYDDNFYLDKVFVDAYACDDMNFILSFTELAGINSDVRDMFDNSILNSECKVICLEWYDGTDMPIEWDN